MAGSDRARHGDQPKVTVEFSPPFFFAMAHLRGKPLPRSAHIIVDVMECCPIRFALPHFTFHGVAALRGHAVLWPVGPGLAICGRFGRKPGEARAAGAPALRS